MNNPIDPRAVEAAGTLLSYIAHTSTELLSDANLELHRSAFERILQTYAESMTAQIVKDRDEANSRAAKWADVATLMLSELRQDYAPLTTTDSDGPKMIRALRKRVAEWQPISTAPKNRIRVIGGLDNFVVGDLFFGEAGLLLCRMDEDGYMEERSIKAWRYSIGEDQVPEHMLPSHWQPLPEGPKP